MIKEELIRILACPVCSQRPPVKLNAEGDKIICTVCGRKYPVRNGIPVMLAEEAEKP